MRSPLRTRLTAISRVDSVIAGRRPKSAPVVPSTTEMPYSAPPGRTQSACASGQPSTAAELASERSPAQARGRVVEHARSALRVCAPSPAHRRTRRSWRSGSSARCPRRPRASPAGARTPRARASGAKPRRCMPVSTLSQHADRIAVGAPASSIASWLAWCTTVSTSRRRNCARSAASSKPDSSTIGCDRPAARRRSASLSAATPKASAPCQRARDAFQAVAVAVGLDHRHHRDCAARGRGPARGCGAGRRCGSSRRSVVPCDKSKGHDGRRTTLNRSMVSASMQGSCTRTSWRASCTAS